MGIRYYIGTKENMIKERKRLPKSIFNAWLITKTEILREYGTWKNFVRTHGKRYIHRVKV